MWIGVPSFISSFTRVRCLHIMYTGAGNPADHEVRGQHEVHPGSPSMANAALNAYSPLFQSGGERDSFQDYSPLF